MVVSSRSIQNKFLLTLVTFLITSILLVPTYNRSPFNEKSISFSIDPHPKSETKLPINSSYCNSIINNDPNTTPHFLNLTNHAQSEYPNINERLLKLRHRWPPYLISYGGSGNSYIRLIIEDITSIYTGAIYFEPAYETLGFAGKQCMDNVIVVKAHPFHIMKDKNTLFNQFLNGECVCNCDKKIHRKHKITKQIYAYKLALNKSKVNPMQHSKPELLPWMNVSGIFLIRDPWKAAWSAFQMAHGEHLNGAYDGAENDQYDAFKNIHTRHLPKYSIDEQIIIETMTSHVWKEWIQTFELMKLFQDNGFEYIVLTLENFMSLNGYIALNEWNKLFGFLLNKEYLDRNYLELRKRMECAVFIGDRHDRMKLIHRKKLNVSEDGQIEYWNIEEVYDLWNSLRVCGVWNEIKHVAEKYGYNIWQQGMHYNITCSQRDNTSNTEDHTL